ncbi:MAG: acetyltransferase [Ilumatobacteraceae bacterium]|nr:acetyltransferase [Ilumatobacteraceae bacterium]MCU1388952.1 acetyltransferase [Ilumatobacteraceae bacterium]
MGTAPRGTWPIVLRSGDGRARVRPWWNDPTVAQLTFIDHGVVPSSTILRVWLSELRSRGFAAVRTGAVTDAGADMLQRQGFAVLQTLHLLDLSLIGWRPAASSGDRPPRSRRLRTREFEAAAAVDLAAFTNVWAIDTDGIIETCSATPAHRARTIDRWGTSGDAGAGAIDDHGGLAGYAITGRADHHGYLQRLAVHPSSQGQGVGLALTLDSLIWMQRRRLTRAVVNTHADNAVALNLYQRVGFRILPQGLTVLVRRLDDI